MRIVNGLLRGALFCAVMLGLATAGGCTRNDGAGQFYRVVNCPAGQVCR